MLLIIEVVLTAFLLACLVVSILTNPFSNPHYEKFLTCFVCTTAVIDILISGLFLTTDLSPSLFSHRDYETSTYIRPVHDMKAGLRLNLQTRNLRHLNYYYDPTVRRGQYKFTRTVSEYRYNTRFEHMLFGHHNREHRHVDYYIGVNKYVAIKERFLNSKIM